MNKQKKEITLDELLSLTWENIFDSVSNKKKAMHSPTLSIQGELVPPRTVILRDFDPDLRQCIFHTDIRSEKIMSMKQSSVAFIHAYDHHDQWQLRMTGEISLSHNDNLTRYWWNKLNNFNKKVYYIENDPGQAINNYQDVHYIYNKEKKDNGYMNFSVLTFIIKKVECLILGHGAQRRSLHQWSDKKLVQHWIAP